MVGPYNLPPRPRHVPPMYTREGGRQDLPAPLPPGMLDTSMVEVTAVVNDVLNQVGPPPGWTGVEQQEGVN